MARIEWTRLSGEDVEAVISMLLCGEYFEAWRVQPGQGDGGIDVFVPAEGSLDRRRVYQVKRYSERLTSSQKRKIKRSLDRAVESADEDGWTIEHWALVTPLDPTPNDIAWFRDLTADLECGTDWIGLTRVEYLAATYPEVVDYYVRDGKERLAAQTDRLVSIIAARADRETGGPLRPEDIRGDLIDVYRAINECDPHYRYGISVMPIKPTEDNSKDEPGLVAVSSSGSDEAGWVTIKIYARSREAITERPITAEFQMLSADDSVAEQYRQFFELGRPTSMPAGSFRARLDLPGGLDINLQSAAVRIVPANEQSSDCEDTYLLVGVMSPEQEVLAELVVERVHKNAIPRGGQRTVWRDSVGFVEIEIVAIDSLYPDLTITFSISVDPAGGIPDEIAPSLQFAAHLHDPNTIAFATTYGPRNWSIGSVNGGDRARDPGLNRLARLATALTEIQPYTSTRLRFPREFTGDQAIQILNAARLLTGEPVSMTWHDGLRVVRDPEATDVELDYSVGDTLMFRVSSDLTIELDGRSIVVGRQMAILEGRITEISDHLLAAEPIEGTDSWLVRFDGDDGPGRVSAARR